MAAHQLHIRPEPTTAAGEILVSHNHIALLHGLYDRPDGIAPSYAEWVRAGIPHVARFRQYPSVSCLRLATGTVHYLWVKRSRSGRSVQVALTERGRAIVERTLPARIRGWGPYEGIKTITWKDRSGVKRPTVSRTLPPESIREAVAYADAYGIPLLEHVKAEGDLTIVAVATELGGSFVLKTPEELELRGPRRWHGRWTRAMLDTGYLPEGYREEFAEYDPDDVLCYLRELKREDADKEAYCRAYGGRHFLSEARLQEWLSEEINFLETDIDPSDLTVLIRALSDTHCKLVAVTGSPGTLSWRHPDTGGAVGHIRNPNDDSGIHDIVASTCAALSCLQFELDSRRLGIRIETRYFPPSELVIGAEDRDVRL